MVVRQRKKNECIFITNSFIQKYFLIFSNRKRCFDIEINTKNSEIFTITL